MVQLVGQRISPCHEHAPERAPGTPVKRAFVLGGTVEQHGEDAVFGRVRELSHQVMEDVEGGRRDLNVNAPKEFTQQPGGKRAAEACGRHVKDETGPRDGRQPPDQRVNPRVVGNGVGGITQVARGISQVASEINQVDSWGLPW